MLLESSAQGADHDTMRVLIASAPHRDTFGYSMPPPGLLRLGGALREAGIDVELEDLAFRLAGGDLPEGEAQFEAAADQLLARGAPDLLGLSVMGATLPAALSIAELIAQRHPTLPIILGGPGTTGIDRELVERFAFIFAVARGEAEITLPELVQRLAQCKQQKHPQPGNEAPLERDEALAGLAGITWRRAGAAVREPDRAPLKDLGQLPENAWDLLPPLLEYKRITGESEGLTPIDSGRGCIFDCSFCTIGRFWGRRSRTLPSARLVREVLAIRDMPGARNAYLCHDIFGAERDRALEFCEAMGALEQPLPWECRARVDHLDPELIAAMGRAGCYRVLLGIESADARVREHCNKQLSTNIDILGRLRALLAAGITPIVSLILGLPGEDRAALAATCEFAMHAALLGGVQLSFHLPNPQPGCKLGEEEGARSRAIPGIEPDMAFGTGDTPSEAKWIAAHPDLFSSFALLTGQAGGEQQVRNLHAIASLLPEILMRYPRSFALWARNSGMNALESFERLRATGRSFEAALRSEQDAQLDAVLAWEQAILRCAARAGESVDAATEQIPAAKVSRVSAELLCVPIDLRQVGATLLAAGPAPEQQTHHFAVAGGPRGVRTLKIKAELFALLQELKAQGDLGPWLRENPEALTSLAQLASEGLLTLAQSEADPPNLQSQLDVAQSP